MKKKFSYLPLLCGVALLIASCQKKTDQPFEPAEQSSTRKNNSGKKENQKIYVSTLDELYAAVNNTDNEGARLILAPGTYVLNTSYPKGGRLELQTDMSLQGQPGAIDAVLIDMSALSVASFVIPEGRTGGIRMGKGTNSLEWLSLKGGVVSANPFSVVNTDLVSTETTVNFSHVFVDMNGSNLGINIRNRLAEHANRKIYSELTDCEITGGVNFNGGALALQNANGASGSLIDVTMRNNYIHGNKMGLFLFSTTGVSSIENCTIKVSSYSDRLEGNGVGMDPSAGVNQSAVTTANNNVTTIDLYGTSIKGNNPPGMPQLTPVNGALPGAAYLACAYNSVNNISGFNRASNNTMTVKFHGCDISDNNGTDIHGYAAWCPPAAVLAGSNNLLNIHLYGPSANAIVSATASSPAEPAGTNVINVFRY
ncbi:MAG TPA: hypothetical protein VF476_07065 [Chitinophagaceae bacterium]